VPVLKTKYTVPFAVNSSAFKVKLPSSARIFSPSLSQPRAIVTILPSNAVFAHPASLMLRRLPFEP